MIEKSEKMKKFLLVEEVKVLKEKQFILEKQIENKKKQLDVQLIQPITHSNEESVAQAMSQVSLKELEVVGLRNQNKNMEDANLKKEEESKIVENKYKGLLDQNDKLAKQLARKFPLQGERHLISDMIIAEAIKLKTYLNYILNKEIYMLQSRVVQQ